MDKLHLEYLKNNALQTRKVRFWLNKGVVPEDVDGDPILVDMYSTEKLQEEPVKNARIRIGPEYQCDLF